MPVGLAFEGVYLVELRSFRLALPVFGWTCMKTLEIKIYIIIISAADAGTCPGWRVSARSCPGFLEVPRNDFQGGMLYSLERIKGA